MKKSEIPQFGMLQGLNVVFAGSSVAGPFAATLMGEMGASVIWVENARAKDVGRLGIGTLHEAERRNLRTIALDTPSEGGREVFARLIAQADIFIENAKSGQYEKWGMTDEWLWEINPKLIIAHVSGYGQTGDPAYMGRGSYDPVSQAFNGLMFANTREGQKPTPAHIMPSDYLSAYLCCSACLAAYINLLKTGVPESIDVAQYEAVVRCGSAETLPQFNQELYNYVKFNPENNPRKSAAWDAYKCSDGEWVFVLGSGGGAVRQMCDLFGIEYGTDVIPKGTPAMYYDGPYASEGGKLLEEGVRAYCASHTAQEVDEEFNRRGIPASRIQQWKDMADNAQFKARESLTTWHSNIKDCDIVGPNAIPKVKNHPGQIWRGAPTVGMDNDDILEELGFTPDQVAGFYSDSVVVSG